MKIGVLGAGISGLSIAKLLNDDHEVEILELNKNIGGIARTKDIDGIPYHITGGHCFNSKYPEVLDFVFNQILSKENWHFTQRNAKIEFKGQVVSYPIEFSVNQIFNQSPDLAIKIVKDFLATEDGNIDYQNLEEWFIGKFGNTLAQEYFLPYNTKIWNRELKEISYEWVEDKLPKPDKDKFISSLFKNEVDDMSHYCFYYPKNNHQNPFINALSLNLNIITNYQVESISKKNDKWIINNEKEYDLIISTLPLNILPNLIKETPDRIINHAKQLKYNKLTTMIWESTNEESTWTYIPQKDIIFHRLINISNFFNSNKGRTITEAVGEYTHDEMVKAGTKIKNLIKPLDFHVSDHAYVIFDKDCIKNKETIKTYLKDIGIITHGRFGDWDYYNMDICIKKSLDLAAFIKRNY